MASNNNIHAMVIGFLNWKPTWLHAFTGLEKDELKSLIKNSDAWYSPRSWEGVSDVIHDFGTKKENFEEAKPLIAGFVGLSATAEFSGYVEHYSKLPDLDDLIANPHNHKCPDTTPVRYALASALSLKITVSNFGQIRKFMKKMPGEMQSSMLAAAARRDNSILDTDDYIEWAVENQTTIF